MKQQIKTKSAPKPIGPYSQAIIYKDLCFLSGQIGINYQTNELKTSSIEEETEMIMKNISNILANKCKSMDIFLRLQYDELIDTKDIGPLVAESIKKYISLDINIELVNNLLKIGVAPKFSESAVSHGYLNGNLFAVTGKFGQISRVELVKIIEKNGGRFSSSLTQKTDVLIYGEKTSSKMDKAKKFNTNLIEFNEFMKDINKNGII